MLNINNVTKAEALLTPASWPWNIILRNHQFSCEELLTVRNFCDVYDIARFQIAATYEFLYTYFKQEVDDSDMLDWDYVANLTRDR